MPPSTRSAKENLEDSLLANSPTIFTNTNTLLGREITFLSISIAIL